MKEHLERLVAELKRYGIKPALVSSGGGHVRVSWQAEGAEPRTLYVASTISDWRGTLNNVAMIRRWCREDRVTPLEARVPLAQKVREKPGKVNLSPIFHAIEQLQAQISELFEYITTPEAVTEEPAAAYSSKRVPSTDLLQYLNERDWIPAAKLAIKWNRPYHSVLSALKQLERKGLAVNYSGVGWKRTPPEAVQVKVKPVVIRAEPPVPHAPQVVPHAPQVDIAAYRRFFCGWTSAKAFAQEARLAPEEARKIIRELEGAGWLAYSAKQGWRLLAKQKTRKQAARQAWGGRTYGVPSDTLLPFVTRKYQPNRVLAAAWGRTLTQTTDALKSLQKRGLVENKRRVGWRLATTPKANGKHHHAVQEQHH